MSAANFLPFFGVRHGSKSFQDLPLEIVEYIISFVPPYQDLKSCMCVCKEWHRIVRDVVRRRRSHFLRCIKELNLICHEQCHASGPTIADRYGHSACYYDKSVYIFGGCTASNTTFNDIWRFDLSRRTWIRPLVVGTYPPPKACATLLFYKNVLVLFGGLSHPHSYSVYQTSRMFNDVHFYGLLSNIWDEVSTANPPPPMAGHSATIQQDLMIVFGGGQFSCGRFQFSSNDVWVLDLVSHIWWKQETTDPKPDPRFGQTQVTLDDNHILIIGGCGGPNEVFSDVWLLSLTSLDEPWMWNKITIRNIENAANQIWCHPGCKVESEIVFLSKASQSKTLLSSALGHIGRSPSRIWTPQMSSPEVSAQRQPNQCRVQTGNPDCGSQQRHRTSDTIPTTSSVASSAGATNDLEVPAKPSKCDDTANVVNVDMDTTVSPSNQDTNGNGISENCAPDVSSSSSQDGIKMHDDTAPSASGMRAPVVIRNTSMPSVRPNAMKNRQRQLEGFQRMEERIRNLLHPSNLSNSNACRANVVPPSRTRTSINYVDNPMYIYVLDISRVISHGQAEWRPNEDQHIGNGPEETTFYSLTCARGELMLFGGIQKDHNTEEIVIAKGRDVVSNRVFFLYGKPVLG